MVHTKHKRLEKDWSDGVLEHWSDGLRVAAPYPILHHSIITIRPEDFSMATLRYIAFISENPETLTEFYRPCLH
jgi:hypothetical protein